MLSAGVGDFLRLALPLRDFQSRAGRKSVEQTFVTPKVWILLGSMCARAQRQGSARRAHFQIVRKFVALQKCVTGGVLTALMALPVAVFSIAGCGFSLDDSSSGGDFELGREVYAANCAVCHGADAEGQAQWHEKRDDGTLPPPPLNGDGHTWHHGDGLLYRIVSEGGETLENPNYPQLTSAMPAFKGRLTHDEIISVLEYVKSLWGDKMKLGISIRESQLLVSEKDPYPSR